MEQSLRPKFRFKRQPSTQAMAIGVAVIAVLLLITVYIFVIGQPTPPLKPASRPSTSNINLLSGQWHYMPGVTVAKQGLLVQSRNIKIVEQDGSGGQADPPVNEYGTHLNVQGGFTVTATLKDIHGPAAFRLYASPPEVSDEFRVEPKSVSLTVTGHQVVANLWNGNETTDLATQGPTSTQTYALSGSDTTVNLSITDSGNVLIFTANGRTLGMVPDEQLFNSSHTAWFGFDAERLHNSFVVSALSAAPSFGGTVSTENVAALPAVAKSSDGLQALASRKRPGFLIGTDIATWAATSSTSYDKMVFGGDFGIVTPENAMKWQFTEPEPGVFDFHEADAIVAMAEKNHLQVHGHNLVFSEALPAWVRNLPTQTAAQKAYVSQVLYNHVYTTVAHFKGKIDEWDINEPFAYYDDNGNMPAVPFTSNVFYQALGESYIQVVAKAAVAADPNVHLWVNDYGAENDNGAYWQFVYATMKKWKVDWGLPIYGFGFESHIYEPTTDDIANAYDDNGQPILNDHINEFATIGIQSRISEMDAPLEDPGYTADDSSQAQQFAGVLSICINNPHCVAFSTWSSGMTDIWQDDNYSLQESVDSMFGLNNLPDGNAYAVVKQVLE